MNEPSISCLPRSAAEYVHHPPGHPAAGTLRTLDLGVVLLAVLVIQVLVLLYTRKRAK